MPESAKWPTPYPRCPALESSSSIKLAVSVHPIRKEHRTGLALFDMCWTNPWCEMVNEICKNITRWSLVMDCQVLFTFLKRVRYKWMPYLVVFYFFNVGSSMRFTPMWPPGGSIVLRHDFYLLKSFVQRGGGSGFSLFTLYKSIKELI